MAILSPVFKSPTLILLGYQAITVSHLLGYIPNNYSFCEVVEGIEQPLQDLNSIIGKLPSVPTPGIFITECNNSLITLYCFETLSNPIKLVFLN